MSKKKQSQTQLLKQVKKRHGSPYKNHETLENIQLDRSQSIAKVTSFENLLYYKKGMRLQEVTKLKRGEYSIQQCLDLHGLTIEEAEVEIFTFLNHAFCEKYRYIRIIHGKGYNSKEEFPALKNLVNLILRLTKTVIGFASTPERDGGTGAVKIILKAQ